MTGFTLFGIYCLVCYLALQLSRPLQPDQPCDELSDVDVSDVHRQREIRNTLWWESPVVNVVLSRRRRG